MKGVIGFSCELQANNNREWFNAHKAEFLCSVKCHFLHCKVPLYDTESATLNLLIYGRIYNE